MITIIKLMKIRPFILKSIALLGFSPLYFIKLHAQNNTAEKREMHIRMIQDKNGKRIVIDTLIKTQENFDVNAYLRSKGITDPETKTSRMVFYDVNRQHLDSLVMRSDELRVLSKHLTTNLPAFPPVPPMPPFALPIPPVPPFPDSAFFKGKEWVSFRQFITDRSGFDDTLMMITGPATEMNWSGLGESFRQLDSMMQHVKILKLNKDEMRERKATENKNELDVEQLNFYPNPNNGLFKLRFNLSEKATTVINITGASGKEVFTEKLKAFSGVYEKDIDLTGQAKGIYYLTVKHGKQAVVRKLVIE